MNSKLLAIDMGTRKAGLAFCPQGEVIFAIGQIEFADFSQALDKIIAVIEDREPKTVVFGLPLNKEQQMTEQAKQIKEFARQLSFKLNIKVDFIDEYLSTWQAKEDKKKSKKPKEEREVDQEAARIILNDYLNKINE